MKFTKTLCGLAVFCVTTSVGTSAIYGFNITPYMADIMNQLPSASELKDSCEVVSMNGVCKAVDALLQIPNQLDTVAQNLTSGFDSAKINFSELVSFSEETASHWAGKASDFADSIDYSDQMKKMKSHISDQ